MLPKAVDPDTRDLRYVSPSQIKQFATGTEEHPSGEGCNRKWALVKVFGHKEPQRSWQTEGIKVHSQVEHYLGTGQDGLGPVARLGMHLLPTPGEDLIIETKMETLVQLKAPVRVESLVVAAGVPVVGRIDLVNPRGLTAPVKHRTDVAVGFDPVGTVEIGDHKTSKHPKWMKTSQALGTDAQMLSYGMWVRAKYPDAKWVRLSHFYYGTEKRFAEKVSLLLPLTTVLERWESDVTPVVEDIKVTAHASTIEDVEPNWNACGAYGGCAFSGTLCQKQDPMAALRAKIMEKKMPLGMVKKAPQVPQVPQMSPAQIAAVAQVKAVQETVRTLKIEDSTTAGRAEAAGVTVPEGHVAVGADPVLDAKLKAKGLKPGGQGMVGLGDTWTPQQVALANNKAFREPSPSILPPDAPESDMVLAAEAAVGTVHQGADGQWWQYQKASGRTDWVMIEAPKPADDVATTAGLAGNAPGDSPKRKRRTKAEMEAARAEATPVSNPAESTVAGLPEPALRTAGETTEIPAPVQPPPTEGRPTVGGDTGFILYVDCVPSGGHTTLDTYVDSLHEEVCGIAKVADIRSIPYQEGFGLLRRAARDNPPGPGEWVIHTTALAAPVIDALCALASKVVRAVAVAR